jgi:methylmalonyl-CoA carboxyltransferase small subunit
VKLKIAIGAKAFEVDVEVLEEDAHGSSPPPRRGGTVAPPPPPPLPRVAPPATDAGSGEGCRSPIAGLVTRVLAKTGQKVEANDPLIVLEAMKMESNILAPKAGTVGRVLVAQGDAVKIGQLLVELG